MRWIDKEIQRFARKNRLTERLAFFLAGLIVGGLACVADCKAQTIGINTVTAHTSGGYRWDTPGLYVRRDDGLTLGVLRNSLGRASIHVSQTWERGPWAVQAGTITGYPMAPVVPLLTGSVLIGNHHRLVLIPGPRNRMALHYAVEWQ